MVRLRSLSRRGWSRRLITNFLLVCFFGAAAGAAVQDAGRGRGLAVQKTEQAAEAGEDIRAILEPIRLKYKLPALGAAIVTGQGLQSVGVAGVRKAGTDVPATADDLWHLGSDTKAMTAYLIAALVEQGQLKWDTTVGESFPELAAAAASPKFKTITLRELLSHRSGLPANIPWGLIPRTQQIKEQRLAAVKAASSARLNSAPGTEFLYSNLGYVVAGAMAEKAAGETWEELMRKIVFEPLGMTSAGFGGVGTPGQVDQPWGHATNGQPVKENGPNADNPPVMGPAGTVHCTLADWAKFIADVLRGARGEKALLDPALYEMLQAPAFDDNYAFGWIVADRDWGGGKVLTHSGSNTMNLAVAWVAPLRDIAVLIVTNQGPPASVKACDEAASALIRDHLKTDNRDGPILALSRAKVAQKIGAFSR
jgi:CubicO group peptidase (beta-lactamase class C family)